LGAVVTCHKEQDEEYTHKEGLKYSDQEIGMAEHNKINIKRSDGRAHDLGAIAALAQFNAQAQGASPYTVGNNGDSSNGGANTSNRAIHSTTSGSTDAGDIITTDASDMLHDHYHDHNAPIMLCRSDGAHHDISMRFSELAVQTPPPDSERASFSADATPCNGGDQPITTVRIVHMSDTRNFLVRNGNCITKFLPEGDILIHSGNFTHRGNDEDYASFNAWLGAVSSMYAFRIVVPGSRDVKKLGSKWSEIKKRLPNATHVLCHEEATVLGIRIYGCPWFWGNKYNYSLRMGINFGQDEGNKFADIPEGVHVLVSHGPAFNKLDAIYTVDAGKRQHIGSEELAAAIARAKPLVHMFGHCSDSRGFIPHHGRSPLFVNSTMCDKDCKLIIGCPHVVKATQLFAALSTPLLSGSNVFSATTLISNRAPFGASAATNTSNPSPPPVPTSSPPTSRARSGSLGSSGKIVDAYWNFEIGSYI
jgi:Icc-related predicted phosphoesterase